MASTSVAAPCCSWQSGCGSQHRGGVVGRGGMLGRPAISRLGVSVHCSVLPEKEAESSSSNQSSGFATLRNLACGLCAAITVSTALPSLGDSSYVRLPPLSKDPARCEKAFVGNTIGQANGVADKLLDLRFCDYSNDKKNLKGKTLSAALMANAKFDGADLTEVIMSKAYAVGASFIGADFTNAVVDRVVFDNADMRNVKFINTVLSGSTFEGTNLEGADFEDALIGYVDIQKLCRNPTLPEDGRDLLGCKRR